MNSTVKYHGNKYKMYDEQNQCIGEIRKAKDNSKKLNIYNKDKEIEYSVTLDGGILIIRENNGLCFDCPLLYQKNAAGKIIQKAFVRPPMPVKICLETEWGNLEILQTKHRIFEICLNHIKVGEMSHMLSLKKEICLWPEKIPISFYCVIFSLGYLMLHNDDIEII